MHPEGTSSAARLLASLMTAGVRPFQYRHAIYRLLGMIPGSTSSLDCSPYAPPADFRYLTPWAASIMPVDAPQPDTSYHAARLQALHPAPDPGRAPSNASRHAEVMAAAAPGTPTPTAAASSARALGRGITAQPEPEQSKRAAAGQLTDASGNAADAEARVRPTSPAVSLLIPGLTERRSLLAALSARLSEPVQTDRPVAAPVERATTPAPDQQKNLNALGTHGSVTWTRTTQPRSVLRDARPKATATAPLTHSAHSVQPTARPPETPDGVTAALIEATTKAPLAAHIEARRAEDAPARLRATARARGVDAVELVRRAVQNRAASEQARWAEVRAAAGLERQSSEARASAPPAAPGTPRVVTIVAAPPVQRSRVPRAFWSSSVLRCAHLRMLR